MKDFFRVMMLGSLALAITFVVTAFAKLSIFCLSKASIINPALQSYEGRQFVKACIGAILFFLFSGFLFWAFRIISKKSAFKLR